MATDRKPVWERVDSGELRAIAKMITDGDLAWGERVRALPREVLTRETLASSPQVIAKHLRNIAVYIDRRRNGAPFGRKEGEPFYQSWLEAGPS